MCETRVPCVRVTRSRVQVPSCHRWGVVICMVTVTGLRMNKTQICGTSFLKKWIEVFIFFVLRTNEWNIFCFVAFNFHIFISIISIIGFVIVVMYCCLHDPKCVTFYLPRKEINPAHWSCWIQGRVIQIGSCKLNGDNCTIYRKIISYKV